MKIKAERTVSHGARVITTKTEIDLRVPFGEWDQYTDRSLKILNQHLDSAGGVNGNIKRSK